MANRGVSSNFRFLFFSLFLGLSLLMLPSQGALAQGPEALSVRDGSPLCAVYITRDRVP